MGERDKSQKLKGISLPDSIPVFPLTGAIVLPGCSLPLNIFEPRYKAMIKDALADDKIIGMVQPKTPFAEAEEDKPDLCDIGGAGLIERIVETEDGRLLIQLTGIGRFRIAEELNVSTPFRQIRPDFNIFNDHHEQAHKIDPLKRAAIIETLKIYLKNKGLSADISAIETAPDPILVNSLAMIVPLQPKDKQVLLEAPDIQSRGEILAALLKMAILEMGGDTRADIQ